MSEAPDRPVADRPAVDGAVPRRRRVSVLVLLPLVFFAGLAALFLTQLLSGRDPQQLPSALIGAAAPVTDLPALPGLVDAQGAPVPGLAIPPGGNGRLTLVNVFASWCAPCREEHPGLLQIAQDPRIRLVGINYKDDPGSALRFLTDLGNPYAAVGTDRSGRAGIEWGVYGVPESFLVSADGRILWKQTGPFTPASVETGLMPAIEKALAAPPASGRPVS